MGVSVTESGPSVTDRTTHVRLMTTIHRWRGARVCWVIWEVSVSKAIGNTLSRSAGLETGWALNGCIRSGPVLCQRWRWPPAGLTWPALKFLYLRISSYHSNLGPMQRAIVGKVRDWVERLLKSGFPG